MSLPACLLAVLLCAPTVATRSFNTAHSEGEATGNVTILASFANDKPAWKVLNDPVMGGVSRSEFNQKSSGASRYGSWEGEVKIVPKLQAAGFCNLETTNELLTRLPDASSTTHLMLRLRTTTPGYKGFKVSFAARTLNPQFNSFKTGFNITGSGWTTVSIPWNHFSNDWSPFTGDCATKDPTGKQHVCCSKEHPEVCPKQEDLASIQALGLWAEGSSGDFNIDVMWIGAGTPAQSRTSIVQHSQARADRHNNTCSARIQPKLRFNISGRLASNYLPFPTLPLEGLAEAVCCDSYFRDFAEPQDLFSTAGVDLFAHLESNFTFFDSVCGLPLFKGPVGRTFQQFKAETIEHHWPSFRQEEVVTENVVVTPTGEVHSKCGTHLGSNLPDNLGDRFCIDLSCISGHFKRA